MGPVTLPSRLTLQWHITERCNLRCAHCYQEDEQTEMLLDRCRKVLDEFVALLAEIGSERGGRTPGHINITGGEPFAVPWFFDLLDELSRLRTHLSYAILTNGTLLSASAAGRLKTLAPGFVQVSIDGSPATHDRIRGQGTHAMAVRGVEQLVKHGIRTLISFTAHADNYRDVADVAALACRLGVSRFWVDRFIPIGRGRDLDGRSLSPEQTLELFHLIDEQRRRRRSSRTEIAMQRALQFLVAGTPPYRCRAGGELIALLPNGDLLPCRRLPLRAGNLSEAGLRDIYRASPVLKGLRDRALPAAGCGGCFYSRVCGGGLRCLAYALHGDPHRADPGCWLAQGRECAFEPHPH
jgi:radical SAM protein with 4Fe4S-binding SPASM domain